MKHTVDSKRPIRVGLISLGCAKNLVDAEIMLGTLMKDGLEITNDAAAADVVIVNTCSFIDAAQEESVDTILQSAALREARNRGQGLIVSGCLPQRFRDELPKLMPEVDAFMGIDQVTQVTDKVRQALARRAQRLEEGSTFKVQGSKSKVAARLAELDQAPASPEPPELEKRSTSNAQRSTSEVAARWAPSATTTAPSAAAAQSQIGNRQSEIPLVDVHIRPTYIPDYATPRFRLTPRHFAYVKIAEGCNHPCTFCIIPRMRGSHRSRPQPDIVQEARQLIADGVKELNLISQDSTYYGLDLRPKPSRAIASPERFTAAARSLPAGATTLATLLRELNELPGDFWIRLLYTHPAHWTEELIRTIADCPKVARYADIPLQHIHADMLERMRRETSRQYIEDLIARIRAGIPGIALRTTFIVGFPGETEACFEALLEFIRAAKFERLGVFTYSHEEGTRAARMARQVPDEIKRRRRDQAMAEQLQVARQVVESFRGRTLTVLVEGEASARALQKARVSSWEHGLIRGHDEHAGRLRGRYHVARGQADAPDIDGSVFVRGDLAVGQFARVRVLGHTDYDLIAEPVLG